MPRLPGDKLVLTVFASWAKAPEDVIILRVEPHERLQALAKEALEIQDACNTCGLAQRFAEVVSELRSAELNPFGTEWANQHPIVRVWLDKLMSLSRRVCGGTLTSDYEVVYRWANFEPAEMLIETTDGGYWRRRLQELQQKEEEEHAREV